jgi:hypothetical protein
MFNKQKKWIAAALVVLSICIGLLNPSSSSGLFFDNRSIVTTSGLPSAVTTHTFRLTPPTTSVTGSLDFLYCSNSPVALSPCTPPAGLDVSAAVLSSQTGNIGFTIDTANSTANKLVLTRPAVVGNMSPSTYVFDNITNPSTAGQTVYVRIASYPTTDGSGPFADHGGVAFAVQNAFNVDAYVPPFLQLCVGVTVAPDCSIISGDSIDIGILSSGHASAGQTQFSTATNDPTGYIIYALGNTMTSGNNTINSLASPSPSFPGNSQFGINLRANLIPSVGQDPIGLGTASPTANYNIPNRFMFNSGDSIASSAINTNYNRMTVSYLVNIPSNQPPGVYATTITYVATVQF